MVDAVGALDWNQLVTLLGLSAIISGGVSSSISYFIERRREKEKKAAEVIKEQAELYSSFIYNLMILKGRWQSLYAQDEREIQKAKEDIKKIKENIDPLLQNKIYLLTPGLLLTWSYMRQLLESPEFEDRAIRLSEVLSHLFRTLHGELDSNIIKRYEKVVGKFGHVEYLKDPQYLKFLLMSIAGMSDTIKDATDQIEQANKDFVKKTQEISQELDYLGSSKWERDQLEKLLHEVREGLPLEGKEEILSKEERLAAKFIKADQDIQEKIISLAKENEELAKELGGYAGEYFVKLNSEIQLKVMDLAKSKNIFAEELGSSIGRSGYALTSPQSGHHLLLLAKENSIFAEELGISMAHNTQTWNSDLQKVVFYLVGESDAFARGLGLVLGSLITKLSESSQENILGLAEKNNALAEALSSSIIKNPAVVDPNTKRIVVDFEGKNSMIKEKMKTIIKRKLEESFNAEPEINDSKDNV